jgi:tetratricopeptide (TPR) repeat protein/tRNA A-37 threonylcarbamoyl transferase component Bud32
MVGGTLSHYRIVDRIASGGMGDVYRAEDLQLRRTVALKMLREATDDEGARRLLAEARAASALNHPNIAVVYETSEAEFEGTRVAFIAMEYVDGTTLAALAGGAPMDVDRMLDIGDQIAGALAEAHRQGLIHRDLKPSNVMVTPAGRVKLLDFGVARRKTASFTAPDDVTRSIDLSDAAGWFVGTLPYVSPEQATGRDVDGRADMFSLGVILYELACGRPPFGGSTIAQVLESILRDDVPPITDLQRDARLPQLERVVRRMLARDPERRLGSLDEVRAALVSIRAGGRVGDAIDSLEPVSVAVTGFVNLAGGADDDWLGAGLAETLTAGVVQLEGVTVVSRERVSELLRTLAEQTGERGGALHLSAARELRARWLVSGAFQKSREAVRVTASLTDVDTGQLIRTTKLDGTLPAIFDLQDRLVRELADWLRAASVPDRRSSPETAVIDAYEAFSRGVLNRSAETFEGLDRAVTLFERAVRLDPSYARAHIELGVAYATKADYLSMSELRDRAVVSLRRAIELQPESSRGWRELGWVLTAMGQDAEGMAAIRRALMLDPDDATAYAAMARALFIGSAQFAEAADWYDRALERNPKAGWYALQLAHCAALLRQFDRGQRAVARAMELQEAFLSGREGLAIAGGYMRAGHLAALQERHNDALEYFEREIDFLVRTDHALRNRILVELNARLGGAHLRLGNAHKANALFEVALESFERRVRLGADDPFTRYYAASVHAMRGDAEPALAFLERALAELPAFTAARAQIEPEFDGLRGDPRFEKLLASRFVVADRPST